MSEQQQLPLGDYGDEGVGDEAVGAAFRRINPYNQNSDWHRDTRVEKGGFGIEATSDTDDTPNIGPTENVAHMSGKTSLERTATFIECAIVGVSPRFTSLWPDGDRNKRPICVPPFTKFEGGKIQGGLSLFVVLKVDPQRRVWEIPFKVYQVDSAIVIADKVLEVAKQISSVFKLKGYSIAPVRYLAWVTLSAGASRRVGQPPNTGWSTSFVLTLPKTDMTPDDYFGMRVSPEDHKILRAARMDLDAMLASGYRKPCAPLELPRLVEAYYVQTPGGTGSGVEGDGDSIALSSGGKSKTSIDNQPTMPGASAPVRVWIAAHGMSGMDRECAAYGGSFDDLLAAHNINSPFAIPPDMTISELFRVWADPTSPHSKTAK